MKKEHHPLHAYRKQNNLTQIALARRLNVSSPTISNIERGQSHPAIRKILKYCRDYQVDPFVFFPDE